MYITAASIEWISRTEVKPVEVIEIQVKEYLHTITFSEEAREIQEKLYGKIREQ